ncbi:MAG: DUF4249 family protein [bacterium]
MRTSLAIAIGLMMGLLLGGCNDSFNPKAPFEEQYVFQCFLNTSITQIALLSHSYDVQGIDPLTNLTDPSLVGAEILLTVDGTVYRMRDSIRKLRTPSRYDTVQHFYSVDGTIIKPANKVTMTARLPNGKILSAGTTVPLSRAFKWSIEYPNGLHTKRNIPYGVNSITVDWEDYEESEGHLFFPRLLIKYSKAGDSVEIWKTVEVPVRYARTNGNWVPAFPIGSTANFCTFDLAAIDSAMAGIAGNDPNKSNYSLSMMTLYMQEYDTPLSKYYSSIGGSMDQFSIRADRSVYTNVNGGVGILGSYYTNWAEVPLDPLYVRSFGYRYR